MRGPTADTADASETGAASHDPVGRFAGPWLYLLALTPLVTDFFETGAWPSRLREWATEVVVGLLIAGLVYRVRQENVELAALARVDALTGLGNRRAFAEALERECSRARRLRQPLALVWVDLDHFKQVNDRAGHAAGDRTLEQLADAVRQVMRVGFDGGFRLGGDEFALLLPGSSAAQAESVVERIRTHCVGADAQWRDGPLGLSAGIVEFDGTEGAAGFQRRADLAMYAVKQASRAGEAGGR